MKLYPSLASVIESWGNAAAFAMGVSLKDISGVYVNIGLPNFPGDCVEIACDVRGVKHYVLFAQGDEARDFAAEIDDYGVDMWLSMMYGASEWDEEYKWQRA